MASCDPGPQYIRGSFRLADTIASAITDAGGEIMTETEATRILVEDGKVAGVELATQHVVPAPLVVSNADARLTFERLVGGEHLPERYLTRLRRMKPSISAFLLYSAAKIAPAPTGSSTRRWCTPPLMIDQVEALMPGYRDAITFLGSATPKTFEQCTLAYEGAIYRWENVPSQTVPKRLDFRTPLEGLWLAGHWTHPGTGSVRCLLSGAQRPPRSTASTTRESSSAWSPEQRRSRRRGCAA